jgi:hypothetical protein
MNWRTVYFMETSPGSWVQVNCMGEFDADAWNALHAFLRSKETGSIPLHEPGSAHEQPDCADPDQCDICNPMCKHGARATHLCPECLGVPSDNPDDELSSTVGKGDSRD